MANRHSLMWRAPGRRDEERTRFASLMRKVEAIRVREGLTIEGYGAKIERDPRSYAPLQSSTLVGFGSTKGRQSMFGPVHGTEQVL
jgi:hypothetical protein